MELKGKSYIMVKPSGARYINEIEDRLIESHLTIDSRYYVEDWETVANELYKDEIKKHNPIFYEDFQAHIWVNKYFFGNQALVYVFKRNEQTYQNLLDETFKLKQLIRGDLNATKDGTCMFIIDINKIDISGRINENNGRVTITNNGESIEFDDMIGQLGRWKSYFLNYVHCPDAKPEEFERELSILSQFGIFDEKNRVSEESFALCKRMRSCNRPYSNR